MKTIKLASIGIATSLLLTFSPLKSEAETLIGMESAQTIAAYNSTGKTTSGTVPRKYFTVAITPKTSGGLVPNYPFGSILTLTNSGVAIPDYGTRTVFIIEDINPRDSGESVKAIDNLNRVKFL